MVDTLDRFHRQTRNAADEPDLIQWVYDAAREGVPIEDVRKSFGAQRVYIPAKPQMSAAERDAIARELQSRTAAEVARRHGISVRQAYRIRKDAKPKGPAGL
jgi:DNA-binding CsgD family transcriptional regulator